MLWKVCDSYFTEAHLAEYINGTHTGMSQMIIKSEI